MSRNVLDKWRLGGRPTGVKPYVYCFRTKSLNSYKHGEYCWDKHGQGVVSAIDQRNSIVGVSNYAALNSGHFELRKSDDASKYHIKQHLQDGTVVRCVDTINNVIIVQRNRNKSHKNRYNLVEDEQQNVNIERNRNKSHKNRYNLLEEQNVKIEKSTVEIAPKRRRRRKKKKKHDPGGLKALKKEMKQMMGISSVKPKKDNSIFESQKETTQQLHLNSQEKKIIRVLNTVSIFEGMLLETLAEMAREMEEMTFQDGYSIIKQGAENDNEFYVLIKGSANVLIKRVAVAALKAPTFFGELALLNDAPRNATIKSRGTTTCLILRRAAFNRFVKENTKRCTFLS